MKWVVSMIAILDFINTELMQAGIPYEYGEWTAVVPPLYLVGEYSEFAPGNESGLEEKTFILNGFTRGPYLALEEVKETIKDLFPPVGGKTAILDDGSGIAVFYATSYPVPTGEEELKRIQINLSVKYWKVR